MQLRVNKAELVVLIILGIEVVVMIVLFQD